MVITILLLAALAGFLARMISGRSYFSWFIGCSITPMVILLKMLLFPYQGEGALLSFGIALIVGGSYGAVASTAGVLLARYIHNRQHAK